MSLPRPFSTVRTADQWRRVAFERTALIGDIVQLGWAEEPTVDDYGEDTLPAEGLAFDDHCRLYLTARGEGKVRRLLWANGSAATPVDLLQTPGSSELGDFISHHEPSLIFEPRAVAVDNSERLFVADAARRALHVFDLWSSRLLHSISVDGIPVDLTVWQNSVVVAQSEPAGLLSLDARTSPQKVPLPAGVVQPYRIAASQSHGLFALDRLTSTIFSTNRSPLHIPHATDIEFQDDDTLVVARRRLQDFLRFHYSAGGVEQIGALKAKGYDGRGIVRTPDGRIGFLTATGFRHAIGARLRYERSGRVTTFRLDAGEFQATWGRVFLDACVPRDTDLRLHCVAADEPPQEISLDRTRPVNAKSITVYRPDLSPPMPPRSFVPAPGAVEDRLHRRESGHEMPWVSRKPGDRFETYEAPVAAGPGRFLWITLEFSGNGLSTPMVRALRVEHVTHDYMRRLPKVYHREDETIGFLRRYLAMFDGTLAEMDARSIARQALIDPRSAPDGILPWLASFVGLVTDERWPEAVKRQLIEEAIWLFRFRGTLPGLKRFLEIYLGSSVILIEKFRTRGLGAALLGTSTVAANSIIGAGFRIGGALGETDEQFLGTSAEDAFETHAHRFTVIIPRILSPEQMLVVQHILAEHRPAHTLVDVCSAGAGMRVGRGLHVELSSIMGPTSGFRPIKLGEGILGSGGIVGRPVAGTAVSAGRLGKDTRVG